MLAELIQQETFPDWGVCTFDKGMVFPVRSAARIPENASGIIVFLFGYYTEKFTQRNVSRYAIADDYHSLILPQLQILSEALALKIPGHIFVPFIDASPINEIDAAVRAGLGDIGMNGQLLSQRYGSYCFIGEIVTTMQLSDSSRASPRCTRCAKCLDACPSGALSRGGFLRERCRSHITQKKGELSDWEIEQIKDGGMVWGCDRCVDSCPLNAEAEKSLFKPFYDNLVPYLTENNFKSALLQKSYGWRGQWVLERNMSLFAKN